VGAPTPAATDSPATPPIEAAAPLTPQPPADAPRDTGSAQTATATQATATESAAAENAAKRRKRRRRNKNRIPILAGMMVVPMLLLGLAIFLRGRGPEERPPRPRPRPETLRSVPKVTSSRREVPAKPQVETAGGYELVDSDRLLWVPPYPADSPPPPLSLLPPGPAGIVSVPVAAVLANPVVEPLLATFDAELSGFLAAAAKRGGVAKEKIRRCTAAFFPGRDGWPEVALSIELTEPMTVQALTETWDAGASPVEGGAYLYVGEDIDGDAYFIGGSESGKPQRDSQVTRFAVGSIDRIREVAETNGAPIPLVRPMQTLWDATSEQSALIALFTPNFLFADGRQMVLQSVPEFRDTLKRYLIPDVAAFSLSIANHDESLYFELREVPSGGATSATLLGSLRESIERWDDWGNEFNLRSVADPSWRLLAIRLQHDHRWNRRRVDVSAHRSGRASRFGHAVGDEHPADDRQRRAVAADPDPVG
jgi:hypothetical protein